jgi:hypothetical protein
LVMYTKGAFALAKSVGVDLHDSDSLRRWIWQIERRERDQASERGQADERNQRNFEPRTVDLDEIDRRERNEAGIEPQVVDLDEVESRERNETSFEPHTLDLDEREDTMEGGAEKHTIRVLSTDSSSNVGETVSFTAEVFGTMQFNGGAEGGGWDTTYYRLPDGTFRVLLEMDDLTLLYPSDIEEALKRGQRKNFSYGRMTLEEMKAETNYDIGKGYEALAKVHPETVWNRVRDLD